VRVLLVKTSSLGDVIHTLPALTDAARAIPGIQFDWVVEEGFAEIPAWHPAVAQVIPVAIRRWRKNLWQTIKNGEWTRFKQRLSESRYDLVIDAQGLLKSAWLTRYVKAPVAGWTLILRVNPSPAACTTAPMRCRANSTPSNACVSYSPRPWIIRCRRMSAITA
jgi:lipopolysaccharide heptosyltransferase I